MMPVLLNYIACGSLHQDDREKLQFTVATCYCRLAEGLKHFEISQVNLFVESAAGKDTLPPN